MAIMRNKHVGLTIGMAVKSDMIGLYFTLQALRMYHPETMANVELLVVDNDPDSPHGKISKDIVSKIRNGVYIPYTEKVSTSVREQIFQRATKDYVLCMDSHVLVRPGAIRQLMSYYAANPDTRDLLQGPLWYDELEENGVATHFKPTWGAHMYGQWETDERGLNVHGQPFEIPMQGLGLFSCKKEHWPGFNPLFRGFGGEEGYIHEKFRQRGGKCLCLPFLRWAHLFYRVGGPPYPCILEDRFWNYMVGWRELGLDLTTMQEHFRGAFPTTSMQDLITEAERQQPLPFKPSAVPGLEPVVDVPPESAGVCNAIVQVLIGLPMAERKKALGELKNRDPGMFQYVMARFTALLDEVRRAA
jgi:hypothetical protein